MARLLFVLDIGFDRGGPSVHLLQDVIRAGLNEGHEIEVILKNTGGPLQEMPDEFKAHSRFKYIAIKEDDEKKQGFVCRYLSEIIYAHKCSKVFLRRKGYDAVFLQSNTTAYFYIKKLRKLNCRIVFNVQDIFPYNLKLSGQLPAKKISFPIFRILQHQAYRKADCIITISDDMKQTLIKDGVVPSKIIVVYNWSYADTPIVLNMIDPENRYSFRGNDDEFAVVYAGNIGKMQNVELIAKTAQTMQDMQDVHFYIIGDGANRGHIIQMTEGLNNVTILPMQPSRFAESIYCQADLNVIPLASGGIKTALPSKTATVLRVGRPVAFCIDRESCFSSIMRAYGYNNIAIVDTAQENGLKTVIEQLKRKKDVSIPIEGGMLPPLMSIRNAGKYIDVMVRKNDD